jgi:hypothetical protein
VARAKCPEGRGGIKPLPEKEISRYGGDVLGAIGEKAILKQGLSRAAGFFLI